MGNKILRPSDIEPLSGFNDDQLGYLHDKFEILCNQQKLLDVALISQAFKCSRDLAQKILSYIDFENQGEVDFYEFTCAAASLHQNDEDALQFLYDLFGNGNELDESTFDTIYETVFKYLKFVNLINEDYTPEIGQKKFKQYDYNKNTTISFSQFKQMLKNDYHCRLWMQALGFAEQRPHDPPERVQNQQDGDFTIEQAVGEQAGSTPSWIKTVNYLAPDNKEALISQAGEKPNANLQIQYVYGYRCYDTRDNLFYTSNGDIVYHNAGCGIVLNKNKNTQKIITEHNDDVTSLAYCPSKNLAVTGEMGRKPYVIVWDTDTMEVKGSFQGKLERSIATVAISKSGRYVAATSQSDKHQIAVFDLSKNAMIAFGSGPRSVVHALKFSNNEQELILACQKEVIFTKFLSGKIQNKKGIFGKAPLTANYCIAVLNDGVVTGMGNGVLGFWKGNTCSRVYKEHTKPVTALTQRSEGGAISGDSIGTIILWSANLSKQRQISLPKIAASNNFRVISLSENNSGILAGTRGGEIIEINKKSSSANTVIEGHFDKQLWGLGVLQNKGQFVTGGQDKLLIKWDTVKRKALVKKKLDYSISSIDVSINNTIAVGHTNGIVGFYDAGKLEYIKKIQNFKNPDKQVISVVKFSPSGSILAVGYCPPVSQVYLYNVQNCKKIGQCKGSPSRIVSIDFTRDGKSIMINNTSYEILFYNAENGAHITASSSFKGEEFYTLTARFSWQTQGIWPPCSDGSDINSVDRSHSKKFIVTADDFSKVKLFKYPVCVKNQIHNSYKGHSSHVTGIKFTNDDKYVLSIGGLQKSIIQWTLQDEGQVNYNYQQKQLQQEQYPNEQQNNDDGEGEYQYQIQQGDQMVQGQEAVDDGGFGLDVDEGDEALAIKPFEGQVKNSIPAYFKTLSMKNTQPQQDLEIRHVWGIRNQFIKDRVRDQLRYSPDFNSCIFITAALGVEMDTKTKKQKYYQGHSQDLVAFAMTKDRKLCATGQMAQLNKQSPKSKILDIHVWDSESKERRAKLSGFHQRAVYLLEFSPSGKRLLSVGQDDKNSLAVYQWEVGRKCWSSAIDGAKVTGAAWKSEEQYMTVGYKHATLWRKEKGVKCKIQGKWDPMMSVVFWNGKFVSGGSAGTLYLWSGSTPITTKGHTGRIDSLRVDDDENLYSGCSKGIINKWKYSGGKLVLDTKVIDMAQIDKFNPGVLSIDFSPDNYLICTNSSSIYEIPRSSKSEPNIVMQSHYMDELWAESWSPDSTKFVTGGDDKTIRIYDTQSKEMLFSYQMKERIRGLDWQKTKGDTIVVGDNKGKIFLFSKQLELLDEAKTRFSKTKPRQQPFWIEDIKFSPDGTHVAFGAHGGCTHIQIFEVQGDKFGKGSYIKNLISSATLSVDWSQDSQNLAVVSQAYELQFTTLTDKVSASSMRETKWATWSGKFGAYVQYIHQDSDYSNLNAVALSPSGSLVATGSDDQKVRIFKAPVIIPKQKSKSYVGHSSHITKVRFSQNQQFLLSVGGNDRTTILWKILGGKQEQIQQEAQREQQPQENQNQQYQGDYLDADEIAIPRTKDQLHNEQQTEAQDNGDDFGLQLDEGDQFMAVKPWLGAIKQPTGEYYKGRGKAPNVELIHEYAFGYRTKDCRNNLIFIDDNTICYHTAGLGITMNLKQNSQQFFTEHTDDIISFTWNSDKSAIFTSEMGAKPIIHQWTSSGAHIQKYKGAKKGVSAIGVNEKYVAAAGMDDDHYIYIFDIQSGKLLCSEKGGREFITSLKWVDQSNFVTVGVKHYKLWAMQGKTIKGKTGQFGKNCNLLTSLVVKNGKNYVGASDGALQIWNGNSCGKSIKVHQKSLNALCVGENVILTGSKDQTIKILELESLKQILSIDCKKLLTDSVNAEIEALDFIGNKILVGTKGSQIYTIQSSNPIEQTEDSSVVKLAGHHMSGHYAPNYVTNEVWGLAKLDNRYYISSSDDGTLRVWDSQKKEQVTWVNLDVDSKGKPRKKKAAEKFLPASCKANCIWVSSGGQIIVGCRDGKIRVLDKKFKFKYEQDISKKEITQVKLSPDEEVLAVGDRTGKITLLSWNPDSKMKVRPSKIKHHSAIKHLDFSADSNIIHSTCTSYELLFWDVTTGRQITNGATMTRDTEWATWSLSLGWPVQGIFEPEMDGTDINAVDRSNNTYGDSGMKLVATSDDRGHVRILEYPCLVKNSQAVVGCGHSSHVTNIRWSDNDERIFSTGGEDQTVIQWVVKSNI